jgi:phage gp36-like protein
MAEDYATTADVIARFNSDAEVLHLIDNAAGSISDATTLARLRAAIYRAEGTVNGYLAKRYDVPIDTSSDTNLANTLEQLSTDLAEYHLVASRSEHISEALQRIHDEAIEFLRAIASAEINLPAEEAVDGTEANAVIVSWGDNDASTSSERVFSRSKQARL